MARHGAVAHYSASPRAIPAGACRTAWRLGARPTSLALVGLGLANLAGALALDPSGAGGARAGLEALHANFTPFAWALIVWAAANTRPGARPVESAAALTLLGFGALTLAGIVAFAHQFALAPAHAAPLEPMRYLHGVLLNIGWPTAQLATLLAASGALTRKRWVGVAVATTAALALNLLCEHPLLAVGAPVGVRSDMNGYGPALPAHLAAGGGWTGCAVLMLVAAEWRHGRRPSPGMGAAAWLAFCAAALAAAWLLNDHARRATLNTVATPAPAWPAYRRGELLVEFDPHAHRIRSRGVLILANTGGASVPVLHLGLRQGTEVRRLAMTGELTSTAPLRRSYRLNRPLEPKETLKIAFDFSWADAETILANGASACLADLVPLPGGAAATGPRTTTAPCPQSLAEWHGASIPALRLRIGTAIDQIAIAPGEPTGAWKENGQAFFEYTPAGTVPLSATVHSGRYATADTAWRGVTIHAHHHPAHAHLAARMLAHGAAALAASAAPQTGRWLHVVEVPDHTPLHRPPTLLGFPRRVPTPPPTTPTTGVLRYSEHAPMAVSKVAG